MADQAISKSNVLIRLPEERWAHIVEEHSELSDMRQQVLDTITHPDRILPGSPGEKMAVCEIEPGKWLVAVYKEIETDGFVITAFLTRRVRYLEKRTRLWPP
ncbi:MAG: hypothetical protein ACYDBJ_10860 [Aggregatilineales bacterium]